MGSERERITAAAAANDAPVVTLPRGASAARQASRQ
jgi:hypothetical protein